MINLVKLQERQTPIEIALQIDENGMTTAKFLYEYAGLDKRNYSRWCKKNIIDNPYAVESADYWAFFPKEELGGQSTIDYKLSSDFAKKLCMVIKNPKGEEARDYFIRVEQNAKKFANSVPALPQTPAQLLVLYAQQFADQEKMLMEQQERITGVEQKVESVKNVFVPQEDESWREMIRRNINQIVDATNADHKEIYNESYELLDKRGGFDIGLRLKNRRSRMLKQGATRTEIKRINKLDIIENDAKAKDIYTGIIREMVLRYVV